MWENYANKYKKVVVVHLDLDDYTLQLNVLHHYKTTQKCQRWEAANLIENTLTLSLNVLFSVLITIWRVRI